MNPKQFLQLGGYVLVLVAILGFIGVIGPTTDRSIFGEAWWFDNGENWAHLILGIVALIFAYGVKSQSMQKAITVVVGIVALVVTLSGFFAGPNFLGANLENPLDNILHLVVGIWALWAGLKKPAVTTIPGPAAPRV